MTAKITAGLRKYLGRKIASAALALAGSCVPDTSGLPREDAGTPDSNSQDGSNQDGNTNGSITFSQNLSSLEEKLQTLRWVSYAPTNFNPAIGMYPGAAVLEEDLTLLYQTGFRGLITYGSENTLAQVPCLAKELGFAGVIMGIWVPSTEQMNNALAQQSCVDGYSVGNENIGILYSLEELMAALQQLREETLKPVTTTEQFADYFGSLGEQLIALSDWLFPNTHPYWAGITASPAAAQWTMERYSELRESLLAANVSKVLLFKEVGLPSAGAAGLSEENQRDYYQILKGAAAGNTQNNPVILFSYFEAFDQPWKNWAAVEPHWGLFKADRMPKAVTSLWGEGE